MLVLLYDTDHTEAQDEQYRAMDAPIQVRHRPLRVGHGAPRGGTGGATLPGEAGHTWRTSFWSSATTLVAFLLQSLNGGKTLRAAVADVLDGRLSLGHGQDPAREMPSADPSAFCAARRRLPEAVIESTLREVVGRIGALAGETTLWLGRRVKVVDGACVSMPDEPEHEEAFPQPPG